MHNVYLSLGSNEGNRLLWLQKAIVDIEKDCGKIVKKSSIYETAAWGMTQQAAFLNMAIMIQTDTPPLSLLSQIEIIEQNLGRQRHIKWGPRTLDIDILLYDNLIIETEKLKIPHPYMGNRRFVLVPLAEIAPSLTHPILNKTISQMLTDCPDGLDIHEYI